MEHLKARDEQIEEMRREIEKRASTEIGLQNALAVERSWHAQACKDRDDALADVRRLEGSLMRIGERLGLSVVTEPDIMAAIERMMRPEIRE